MLALAVVVAHWFTIQQSMDVQLTRNNPLLLAQEKEPSKENKSLTVHTTYCRYTIGEPIKVPVWPLPSPIHPSGHRSPLPPVVLAPAF